MHRIQIQLTLEQERVLRRLARLRGLSISALVREGVDRITIPEQRRRDRAHRRALALIGAFSDKVDVARRHDDYLAEAPTANRRKRQ
jgi:hypothetical protein